MGETDCGASFGGWCEERIDSCAGTVCLPGTSSKKREKKNPRKYSTNRDKKKSELLPSTQLQIRFFLPMNLLCDFPFYRSIKEESKKSGGVEWGWSGGKCCYTNTMWNLLNTRDTSGWGRIKIRNCSRKGYNFRVRAKKRVHCACWSQWQPVTSSRQHRSAPVAWQDMNI